MLVFVWTIETVFTALLVALVVGILGVIWVATMLQRVKKWNQEREKR